MITHNCYHRCCNGVAVVSLLAFAPRKRVAPNKLFCACVCVFDLRVCAVDIMVQTRSCKCRPCSAHSPLAFSFVSILGPVAFVCKRLCLGDPREISGGGIVCILQIVVGHKLKTVMAPLHTHACLVQTRAWNHKLIPPIIHLLLGAQAEVV